MGKAIRPTHLLLFLLVIVIWAFNFPVSKWGVRELPPMLFVALRFLLVALVLLPFATPPRGYWPQILVISTTLGLLHFACMFTGISRTPGSTAALLVQLQVPFAALLAAAFLDDRLGWRRLSGMVLAFAGVALVVGEPSFAGPWWALALIVMASLFWAVANVMIKSLDGALSGATLNAWVSLLAVPQLLAASLVFETGQAEALAALDWVGVAAVVYNGLAVVVLAYGIWYRLLKRYDVNQAMPFTLLITPLGVLFSGLLLDEALTWRLLAGGLIALAGVGIIVLRRPRVAAPDAARI